jgi:hypothetical protein
MPKRAGAAMLIAVLSTLVLAVPALAAVNTLSSGAAYRAAGRYASRLGNSLQNGGGGTLDGTSVNQCKRLNRTKFTCEIAMDFDQADGSVISCTAHDLYYKISSSNRVFIKPIPNSTRCDLA